MLGFLGQETIEAARVPRWRKFATSGILSVLVVLMGLAGYSAVRLYMKDNRPARLLIEKVGRMIEDDPDIRLSPGNIRLPFTPTHKISYEEHTYQMLHLFYGENIVSPDKARRFRTIKKRLKAAPEEEGADG